MAADDSKSGGRNKSLFSGLADWQQQPFRQPPPAAGDSGRPDDGRISDENMPDTVAVALDYDRADLDGAPRVVASGKGWMAEQILHLAFANGVRVRQDADLVQILAAIDIDSEIPPEAFAAVAEILAYVYKVNGNSASLTGEDD